MIRIRYFTAEDTNEILKLEDRFFQYDKLTKKSLKQYLKQKNSCLILTYNDTIVGYALVIYRKKVAWLCSIAAEKGLGKYLLSEVEIQSKKHACDRIRLEVRTDNLSAKKFYEKHDYKYYGNIENYYEDGCNAFKYIKHIYKLAVLYTPNEKYAPSTHKTIKRFMSFGKKLGIYVDIIDRYNDLSTYNGLFIRDITRHDNYTYVISEKATNMGLVVIDDPKSIVLCTNKILMNELFIQHNIPTPKTTIINEIPKFIQDEYPLVIKIPDGSFSKGIFKVNNQNEMEQVLTNLFQTYNFLIIQEFMYTPYDWRIGILDNKPIFSCKYHMANGYWKIIKHTKKDNMKFGNTEPICVKDVPSHILDLAIKSSLLVGDGLYGVDIKEKDGKAVVIEINDCPNVDLEWESLKDNSIEKILIHFKQKMINQR